MKFDTPPKKTSKLYKEIVDVGCGIEYDAWNGDSDCSHHYGWSCEQCPWFIEIKKDREHEEITRRISIVIQH